MAVKGSGWGWLGYDRMTSKLAIATTANQDLLETQQRQIPLLAVDVWEHAYYLQYRNLRADFVKSIWSIINWSDVAKRLSDAERATDGNVQ